MRSLFYGELSKRAGALAHAIMAACQTKNSIKFGWTFSFGKMKIDRADRGEILSRREKRSASVVAERKKSPMQVRVEKKSSTGGKTSVAMEAQRGKRRIFFTLY